MSSTILRDMGDAALVVAIGRWRQDALAEAFRRHAGAVHGLARRVLGDDSAAEEVVQEIFLRLWNAPDRFDPDRWEGGLASRLPKYAYFPFGGGPRICIGQQFALVEAALVLAAVGQRWRFTRLDEPVEPEPMITLSPAPGIPVVLRRR